MIISCIKSAMLALECLEKQYEYEPTNEIKEKLDKVRELIENYKNNFKQMPEIENRLYYKIAYEGKGIMKACQEVADENYFNNVKPANVNVIHRDYYKKIKKFLKVDEMYI